MVRAVQQFELNKILGEDVVVTNPLLPPKKKRSVGRPNRAANLILLANSHCGLWYGRPKDIKRGGANFDVKRSRQCQVQVRRVRIFVARKGGGAVSG
jgi:hypothetical protein